MVDAREMNVLKKFFEPLNLFIPTYDGSSILGQREMCSNKTPIKVDRPGPCKSIMYTDFQKVFNEVNHNLFLNKLT